MIFRIRPCYYTLQRKSHLCIPILGIVRPLRPNFHIHVSVSDLYISRICPHISCSRTGKSIVGEYINNSQTHEYWSWDCGRAISFVGIFVSNFRYCMYCTCSKSALSSKSCSLSAVEAKRSWRAAFAASSSRIFPEMKDQHVKIAEDISYRRKAKIGLVFVRAELN